MFDGGVPELKKQTITGRKEQTQKAAAKSRKAAEKILQNYIKSQLRDKVDVDNVEIPSLELESSLLQMGFKSGKNEDLFKLPSIKDEKIQLSSTDDEDELEYDDEEPIFTNANNKYFDDLNNLDIHSKEFKSLPPEIRHELLTEMKLQFRSYRINCDHMPKESNEFSNFQMDRLIQKRKIQAEIEQTEKELNSNALNDELLGENCTNNIGSLDNVQIGRLWADENTKFILMKKQKEETMNLSQPQVSTSEICNSLIVASSNQNQIDLSSDEETILNSSQETVLNSFQDTIAINSQESNKSKVINSFHENIISSDETKTVKSSYFTKVCLSQKEFDHQETSSQTAISPSQIINHSDASSDSDYDSQYSFIVRRKNSPFKDVELDMDLIKESDENENENENEKAESENNQVEIINEIVNVPNENDSKILSKENKTDLDGWLNDSFDNYIASYEEESNNFTNIKSKTQVDQVQIQRHATDSSEESSDEGSQRIINLEKPKEVRFISEILKPQPSTSKAKDDIPKPKSPSKPKTAADLQRIELYREKNRQERYANTTNNTMIRECQELLQLFGIPFVISPMEAEAQCATLEMQGLTQGTITDDSDIWLFGGKTVYKNFFANSKHVECYKASDVQQRFGLTRASLICLAILTGSDYTSGLEGVGIVKATEILSEFPGSDFEPLIKFKNWWLEKHKGKDKRPENKIRGSLLKLILHEGFPNKIIYDAYMNPTVETSDEQFAWGMPELDKLTQFAIEKFKWSKDKTDRTLGPVMKKVNEKQVKFDLMKIYKLNVCLNFCFRYKQGFLIILGSLINQNPVKFKAKD